MAYKPTISTNTSIVAYNPRTAAEGYTTGDSDVDVMKASIAKTCTLIPDTKPKIYQLPIEEITIDKERGLRNILIGKKKLATSTKTILLVGETGAGKSTTINALVNYVLNVKWEDDFRFRLVDELKETNQTKSQTTWVTIYTLYHQNEFRIPYSLTIVDTPGICATVGIARDEEITKQLETLFKSEGPVGLDSLDAVGFVVKSPDVRLTPTQHYIYDSVLNLFARNIENNIYMLITFSDGNKPPVLDAIKGVNIPNEGYIKINNSALYSDNQAGGDDMNFDQMFWKMGENSYQTFMVALQGMEPKSLTLTNEVLLERHRLERYIEALEREICSATQKSKQLIVEKEALSKFKQETTKSLSNFFEALKFNQQAKNKSYDFEEIQHEMRKLLPGESVTNCLKCQITCCYPCYIKGDIFGQKYLCSAMTWGAICKYCPENCPTSAHTAGNFRFVLKKVTVTKTIEDIRQRYQVAGKKKLTVDKLVEKVEEEFEAIGIQLSLRANDVKVSLDRLREIALKPNPLSTTDYIDTLIENEKRECCPDNAAIKILQAAKEKHLQLVNLSRTEGNLTADDLSELFEQARIQSRSSGNNIQDAIISAAAIVKTRLAKTY